MGSHRVGWHALEEMKVRRQRTPSAWLTRWGTRKMKLRLQRVPDGLASCRVAHAWRGGGAEAGKAIGVADVLVDAQGEATAAAGTR